MKNMQRALRRHHTARLKHNRAKYFVFNWWSEDLQPRRLGQITQYPKACSCHMCGNPRKWEHQRTVGELRGFDILAEGLKELYTTNHI